MGSKLSLVLILMVLLSTNVFAITGKIGNARMILNAEVGDTIDRSIKVINDNNVSVNITVFASGDLEDEIEILDNSFLLKPGETKQARFYYEATKPGVFSTTINIKFDPLGEKNGVGLSSTVIINVIGEGEIDEEDELSSETTSLITGDVVSNEKMSSVGIYLSVSTLILLIIFLILLYLLLKNKSKKTDEDKTNGLEWKKDMKEKKLKKDIKEK